MEKGLDFEEMEGELHFQNSVHVSFSSRATALFDMQMKSVLKFDKSNARDLVL